MGFKGQDPFNSTACKDILDISLLPTLWQQLAEGPLLFQNHSVPGHKIKLFSQFGAEHLVRPAQSPELKPHPNTLG